jgi:homoserine O-acetyltransferase/O-succinyltransferase
MGASTRDSLSLLANAVRRSSCTIVASLCTLLALALTVVSQAANAHWPGQPEHQFAELGDLKLESGEVIKNFRMSYVTHGKLNAAKDNAILFHHGFAANHHFFDHIIGPGRPLDTDKYFIICPDTLGATQTGYERTTSATNSGLKMKFPFFNGRDIVNASHRLVTETLGVPHLLAVTGISSGGWDSVQYAVSYPQFMDGIFPVVGGALWTRDGRFRGSLGVSIIETCKGWDGGDYDVNPKQCATNALSNWVHYFFTQQWWDQYVDTPEAYTKWRDTIGQDYLDVQDARDIYYRIVAAGRGWVGDTPGFGGDLGKALGSIKAKTLFLYSPQDRFFQPQHIDAQVKMIPSARAVAIDSSAGHMICCNADPNATRVMGDAIRTFLQELIAQRLATK